MIQAWRVGRQLFADLSGEGARQHGGRWNTPGRAMVYMAEHPALAVLEVRVHLDLPPDLLPDEPPEDVDAMPADPRAVGDAWLASGRTAVLRVPSVIVPHTSNPLLNPRHPRAADARITQTTPFQFDPRLWEAGT